MVNQNIEKNFEEKWAVPINYYFQKCRMKNLVKTLGHQHTKIENRWVKTPIKNSLYELVLILLREIHVSFRNLRDNITI